MKELLKWDAVKYTTKVVGVLDIQVIRGMDGKWFSSAFLPGASDHTRGPKRKEAIDAMSDALALLNKNGLIEKKNIPLDWHVSGYEIFVGQGNMLVLIEEWSPNKWGVVSNILGISKKEYKTADEAKAAVLVGLRKKKLLTLTWLPDSFSAEVPGFTMVKIVRSLNKWSYVIIDSKNMYHYGLRYGSAEKAMASVERFMALR